MSVRKLGKRRGSFDVNNIQISVKEGESNGRNVVVYSVIRGLCHFVNTLLSGEQSDDHVYRGPDEADKSKSGDRE